MDIGRTPSRPRRHRLVVGIRGLMLLIVLLALWLGWKSEKARAQRRAFNAFHKSETNSFFGVADFVYDYETYDYKTSLYYGYKWNHLFARDNDSIRTSPIKRLASWIADHLGREYAGDVTRVKISQTSIEPPNDPALTQLRNLNHLEVLDISNGMDLRQVKRIRSMKDHPEFSKLYAEKWITDDRLARLHLESHPRLFCLDLSGNSIDDAGLVHLESLRRLRILDVGSTLVTGPGLVHLTGLRELEELFLDRTDVDDAGIAYLGGLTRLRTLGLRETRVSPAAIAALKKRFPKLTVQYP